MRGDGSQTDLPSTTDGGAQNGESGSGSTVTPGDGLNDLPDPHALAGLWTRQSDVECEKYFSLVTPMASLLTEDSQSKKVVAGGPISLPLSVKLASKIRRGEYIDLYELLQA